YKYAIPCYKADATPPGLLDLLVYEDYMWTFKRLEIETMTDSYDFIIVGGYAFSHRLTNHGSNNYLIGGTAGVLFATRLAAALPESSVVVLESGSAFPDNSHFCKYDRYHAWYRPDLDFGHLTTPQTSLKGQVLPYLRGKGPGGCSNVNFLTYLRGAGEDIISGLSSSVMNLGNGSILSGDLRRLATVALGVVMCEN
ncbi:hypothetical protein RJ035_007338, partial [Blastomyces gilchristii]